jgi:hypothetical protein
MDQKGIGYVKTVKPDFPSGKLSLQKMSFIHFYQIINPSFPTRPGCLYSVHLFAGELSSWHY